MFPADVARAEHERKGRAGRDATRWQAHSKCPFDDAFSTGMDLIERLSQFHIVVCRKCQIGVLPNSQWDSHFRRHKVAHRMRQMMKRRVLEDPDIIHNESELSDRFQYPVREPAIEQLPVYPDGSACSERGEDGQICNYVCRTSKGMREHYQQEHDWVNDQKRGGSMAQRQSIERPWRTNVHCQRLFHSGPKNGYWEVQAPAASSIEEGTNGEIANVDEMFEAIRVKQEERESQEQVVRPGGKLDANPWLERVEWARHLKGFHMDTLIPWIELPRTEETTLITMCKVFDRVIDIAQESLVDGHVPFFARVEINRKEIDKDPVRPFQPRMESDTKKRYQQVGHRILAYIHRTYQLAEKPPYKLTERQIQTWDEFVIHAQRYEFDETIDENGEVEEVDIIGINDEGYVSSSEKELKKLEIIDRQCLKFWVALLDHRLDTDHYESAM